MLQVAAYCRVSTDQEDQLHSLESQRSYFEAYIHRNPQWQLAGLYADEGISGTSVRKRLAFQQMISDARQGRFQLLLTKEISRFARNTLDSIYYTRQLKQWGVGVLFLQDNINTLDPDAELRLTILASIAQEESRKTSDRVKWGQKRRMEQGVVFGRSMLGYDVREGQLLLNEKGAQTVRLIFHLFVVEGMGTHAIARQLQQQGIPTCRGLPQWSNTAVLRTLRNEKYCGDLVQKKTFTPDYLTHQKKRNQGQEELVILRNHHPPIVPRELWEQAQEELARREALARRKKSRHSGRCGLSGKIFCGFCGAPFICRSCPRKSGELYRAWRCREAARHGRLRFNQEGPPSGCLCRQVNHLFLLKIIAKTASILATNRAAITQQLLQVLRQVLEDRRQELPLPDDNWSRLKQRQLRLVEAYLDGEVCREDYLLLSKQYDRQLACPNSPKPENVSPSGLLETLSQEIHAALWEGKGSEIFCGALLDHIVIYEKERMDLYFRGLDFPLHLTASLLMEELVPETAD